MESRVQDLAISEGRYAANCLAARSDATDADRDAVLTVAGKRVVHALTKWGHYRLGSDATPVIDTFQGGSRET